MVPGRFLSCILLILMVSLSGCVSSGPEEAGPAETATPSPTTETPAVVTLETFDWKTMPSWEVIDASSVNFTRKYPDFIKELTPMGLWVGERGEELRKIIEENLEIGRAGANTYGINFALEYRDGEFLSPGEEGMDEYIKAAATDGVLAKMEGYAVELDMGFFPPNGFADGDELREALDRWEGVITKVAEMAEKYKFEFFDPCSEFDHLLREDSGLGLSEEEITNLLNEYYPKYISAARNVFRGRIFTQLGDVWNNPVIRKSLFMLNLSGFDMIGMGTGAHISDPESYFKNVNLPKTFGIMDEISEKNDIPWFISEVWIWGEKPVTPEKEGKQAELYRELFRIIDESGKNAKGVAIRFWNLREEDIFSDVMGRPAEREIREYFSGK